MRAGLTCRRVRDRSRGKRARAKLELFVGFAPGLGRFMPERPSAPRRLSART
jgi:hypothetical protein